MEVPEYLLSRLIIIEDLRKGALDLSQPIAELLDKLRDVLKGTPPPWLRKAMQKGQERQFDFDDEVQHV